MNEYSYSGNTTFVGCADVITIGSLVSNAIVILANILHQNETFESERR